MINHFHNAWLPTDILEQALFMSLVKDLFVVFGVWTMFENVDHTHLAYNISIVARQGMRVQLIEQIRK